MAFKALVQAINQSIRERDNVLTLNSIHSLKRDIRNDLIEAFVRAEPLIEGNTSLYKESTSFLDFLFKLCQIQPPELQTGDARCRRQQRDLQNEHDLQTKLDEIECELDKSKRDLKEQQLRLRNELEDAQRQCANEREGHLLEKRRLQHQLDEARHELKVCNAKCTEYETTLMTKPTTSVCHECSNLKRDLKREQEGLKEANQQLVACNEERESFKSHIDTYASLYDTCVHQRNALQELVDKGNEFWKDYDQRLDKERKAATESNDKLERCNEKLVNTSKELEKCQKQVKDPVHCQKCVQYETQLQTKARELKSEQEGLKDSNQKLVECFEQRNLIQRELDTLKNTLNETGLEWDEERERIQHELEETKELLEDTRQKLDDEQKVATNSMSQRDECNKQLGSTREALEQCETKLSDCRSRLKSVKDRMAPEHCGKCMQYETQLERMAQKLATSVQEREQLQNQLEELNQNLKTCQESSNAMFERLATCNEEREKLEAKLEQELLKNTTPSSNVMDCSEEASFKQCRECTRFKQEIGDLQTELRMDREAQKEAIPFREKIEECERQLETVKEQLAECQRDFHQKQYNETVLRNTHETTNSKLLSCQSELIKVGALLNDAKNKCVNDKRLLNTLKGDFENLNNLYNQCLKDSKEDRDALKIAIKDKEEYKQQLQEAIENARKESPTVCLECENKNESLQKCEQDLKQTHKRLQKYKKQSHYEKKCEVSRHLADQNQPTDSSNASLLTHIRERMQQLFPECQNQPDWNDCFFKRVVNLQNQYNSMSFKIHDELSKLQNGLSIITEFTLDQLASQVLAQFNVVHGAPPTSWNTICTLLDQTDPDEIVSRLQQLLNDTSSMQAKHETLQGECNLLRQNLLAEITNLNNQRTSLENEKEEQVQRHNVIVQRLKDELDSYKSKLEHESETLKLNATSGKRKESFNANEHVMYSHKKFPRVQDMYDELKDCRDQLRNVAQAKPINVISINILKNLFQKLYEKHFQLVWNQYWNIIQKEESVLKEIKTKLETIHSLMDKQRENEMLSILLSYIAYDLHIDDGNLYAELYQKREEDTGVEAFLETVMNKTMNEIEKWKSWLEKEMQETCPELETEMNASN